MRNYYFTSVWVSVSGSGADSVLCSLFGVLYFRLEIYLSVSGFGFSILLVCFFFRVLHVYFRVLSVCFVLRASRKTFSFLKIVSWFYFVFSDSGSCASVLESVFLFWVLVFLFGFCGMYFPYRPPYIWPPFDCKSIH